MELYLCEGGHAPSSQCQGGGGRPPASYHYIITTLYYGASIILSGYQSFVMLLCHYILILLCPHSLISLSYSMVVVNSLLIGVRLAILLLIASRVVDAHRVGMSLAILLDPG